MLQNRKQQHSEQEESALDKIREKFSQEQEKIIDTEIVLQDRIVRIIVEQEEAQACGCGGVETNRIEVFRTVPGDSPFQDGDTVKDYDDSDEIIGYL